MNIHKYSDQKIGQPSPTSLISISKKTVLVIGGHGFIGRHIVAELKSLGASVLIGTRGTTRRSLACNERQIALHKLQSDRNWQATLDGVDVVINAVGILRQRRSETYEQVHHHAVKTLADTCADKRIRFIHVSALGLDNPVKSRFLSSKRRGEEATRRSDGDWYIVRPSLVEGEGGYGATWFKRVSTWPVHFVPNNARGIIAPINANDLGRAISMIALNQHLPDGPNDRIYELGGPRKMNLLDYLSDLANRQSTTQTNKPLRVLVPAALARTISHLCDLFQLTPFSFGHYELLKYDNCPRVCRLGELLGQQNNPYTDERNHLGLRLHPNIIAMS